MTGQGQTVSCIPLWVLKDIKNYIKKSSYYRRSQSISPQNHGNKDNCNRSGGHVRRRMHSEERFSGKPLRVAVIGGDRVGKSALTVRFLTKRFIGEYKSDSDMLYRSVLRVSDTQQGVELLDCSGDQLKKDVLDWAEAFIVVYSITDRKSLETSEEALKSIDKDRAGIPLLLCANKGDLDHQRAVTRDDGDALAISYSARFAEVSAAEDYNSVSGNFDALLKDVRVRRGVSPPRYRRMSPKLLRTLLTRQSSSDRPTELIVLDKSLTLGDLTNSTAL